MKLKNQKGTTLIETILYIGLLSIVLVFLIGFFQQSTFLKGKISDRIDNLQNGQNALNTISWYLQNAKSLDLPTPGNSSDNLILYPNDEVGGPIKFFVADNILKMQIGSAQAQNLISDRVKVKSINFSNFAFINQPAIVQVRLSLESINNFWQSQPIELQTSVKLER